MEKPNTPTEEYIPFGPEWEKEIEKFTKPFLIQYLGRELMKAQIVNEVKDELHPDGNPAPLIALAKSALSKAEGK